MDQNNKRTIFFNIKWLVFVGAYVTLVLVGGFQVTMGKLFVIILDTYNDTRAATAIIQSVTIGVFQGSGILTGALVHKFGPRNAGLLGSVLIVAGFTLSFMATSVAYLIFSIGICFGFGLSLAFISCSSVVGMCFDDKNSLIAISMLATGAGVGGAIYPYIIDILNEQYGLRGSLLIIGGMTSHGIALSLLYGQRNTRQLPKKDKNKSHSDIKTVYTRPIDKVQIHDSNKTPTRNNENIILDKGATNIINFGGMRHTLIESMRVLFRNKCFLTYCMATAFVIPAVNLYTIFFIDIYIDKGLTIADASLGLIIFNILGNVGRLIHGLLTRLSFISKLTVPILASTIVILATIMVLFAKTFIITTLCTCSIGFANGMFKSGLGVTTFSIVGKCHYSNGLGILLSFNCVPSLAVGPLSGWLRDKTGSYTAVFITDAVMMGLGLLLFILAQCFHNQNMKSRKCVIAFTTKL